MSVCPSQVGVLSKRLNESSWFSACELPSTRPTFKYIVLKRNSVRPISKNKGTSLWNFALNSGLRKFRHGISIVEMYCYQLRLLSSRKVDAQSVINWAVVGQLSRQYLRTPTLDHYSLSHRSSSTVYSTILSHGSISDS